MYHFMVNMRDGNGNIVKQGFVYADNESMAIKKFKEKYEISSDESYLHTFDVEQDD